MGKEAQAMGIIFFGGQGRDKERLTRGEDDGRGGHRAARAMIGRTRLGQALFPTPLKPPTSSTLTNNMLWGEFKKKCFGAVQK
jgi:hypothetical protein